MVAGDVEERHLQAADVALELAPLGWRSRLCRSRVALDQVADGEDELRLQEVELLDGLREDAGAVAAGAVADDGEVEVGGVVVQPQVSPGVTALDRHGSSPADSVDGEFWLRERVTAAVARPMAAMRRSRRFIGEVLAGTAQAQRRGDPFRLIRRVRKGK